jgi:hypothetical protein
MHWFDWMTLAIVVGVAIIQTIRGSKAGGMGLPAFEAFGLIVAAVVSAKLSAPLAGMMHMNVSTLMIVLFLAFGILAFMAGRWLFSLTGWSFQSMDGFFSFMFGLAAGWTIAYMVLRIIIDSQGTGSEVMAAIRNANAPVAREVFTFRTWNALLGLLFKAKLGPDVDPNVG